MKGTFFQKPLEFNLFVDGEAWNQNDPVIGTLGVKNHSPTPVSLEGIQVQLALGDLKKVRAKSNDAFKLLSAQAVQGVQPLAPQAEFRFQWRFETDRNSPITDTTHSPFLLYGFDAQPKGQIQLVTYPYHIVQEFLKILEISCRFVVKGIKSSKGGLEVKLNPPDGRGFIILDDLVMSFKFERELLKVKYVFNVKKIAASAATVDISKAKREVLQEFAPIHYLTPTERFNHDPIEVSIREALAQVESKISF